MPKETENLLDYKRFLHSRLVGPRSFDHREMASLFKSWCTPLSVTKEGPVRAFGGPFIKLFPRNTRKFVFEVWLDENLTDELKEKYKLYKTFRRFPIIYHNPHYPAQC